MMVVVAVLVTIFIIMWNKDKLGVDVRDDGRDNNVDSGANDRKNIIPTQWQ